MHDDLKAHTFLFCASAPSQGLEPAQNLYMWGHYGLGHRGVAIEFDAEKLAASVVEHTMKANSEWSEDQRVWAPVFYADKINRLSPADFYEFLKAPQSRDLETKLAAQFNSVSRTKSPVWEPEQEWRLMWRNDEVEPVVYKVPIVAGSVRRVFVGVRVSDEVARQVASDCREGFPEAEILKASQRPGEFALDFEPLR
jgi:hypothetical protein